MPKVSIKPRPAWEDRFRRPAIDWLLSSYNKQIQGVVTAARELLAGGASEQLEWRGVPWRWCLVYRDHSGSGAECELAYLIPATEKPVLVVPVTVESLEALDPKTLSRSVRDAIAAAHPVGRVRWPQWDLTVRAIAEDAAALALRHAAQASRS